MMVLAMMIATQFLNLSWRSAISDLTVLSLAQGSIASTQRRRPLQQLWSLVSPLSARNLSLRIEPRVERSSCLAIHVSRQS